MHHRWLNKLDGEAKADAKKRITQHKAILHEAAELLEQYLEEGTPDYDSPSWAFEQADRNGANRKLREVIKFLKI